MKLLEYFNIIVSEKNMNWLNILKNYSNIHVTSPLASDFNLQYCNN